VSKRALVEKARRSVVLVVSFSEGEEPGLAEVFSRLRGRRVRTRVASGVVVDSIGSVLTTGTVCDQSSHIEVILADGERFAYSVVGRDPMSNLGLLRAKPSVHGKLKPVVFGSSEELPAGGTVTVLAWSPWGMSSFTVGEINPIRLPAEESLGSLLELDLKCLPGSSGGAVLNERGELLGLISGVLSPARVEESEFLAESKSKKESTLVSRQPSRGGCAAVPVEEIERVVQDLAQIGFVRRGFLGVQVDMSPAVLPMAPPRDKGVLISSVLPGSPAENAGLAQGDIILSVDDRFARSPHELVRLVSGRLPGDTVGVVVLRPEISLPIELRAVLAQMPSHVAEAKLSEKKRQQKLLLEQKLKDLKHEMKRVEGRLKELE
jgi:serine protease Do